jgi:peptide/nickel transport system permease protein
MASALPILLIVSLITFGMIHLIPGDPAAAIAGLSATPEQIEQLRVQLGLDQPLLGQLVHWYAALLFHGDLGRSLLMGQPVVQVTFERLPVTLALSAYALVLTLLFGLVSGVVAALKHNTVTDQVTMMLAMVGISMPNFWLGLLMILFFAVWLGWLPTGGYVPFTDNPWQWFRSSTMPAISLALLQVGLLARITRSTMLEVLRQDYIRTARAKGVSEGRVLFRHALRNGLLPALTVIGLNFAEMLGGAVLTETVFSWPGIGRYMFDAIRNRDYPVIQGTTLLFALVFILTALAVDLIHGLLDPRVRRMNG